MIAWPLPALVGALLWVAACSLALDLNPREGHPCSPTGACLPGYRCVDEVCVATEGRGKLCDPECDGGRGCDLRTGECVDRCEASVCPTGEVCSPGGACEPATEGLGAPCTDDASCVQAIDGCQPSGTGSAPLVCGCFFPLGAQEGVCLAMPAMADGCDACPQGSSCVPADFSFAGPANLCVPGGFRPCAGQVECLDESTDHRAHCGLLAWGDDPLFTTGASGLGLLSACVSDADGADSQVGEPCDPLSGKACATGLCLPVPGRGYVCTVACGGDAGCGGIASERCVDTFIEGGAGPVSVKARAPVCGSNPTLGASCSVVDGGPDVCGTDAPECVPHPDSGVALCTRHCTGDADCPTDQGFRCHPAGFYCF